MVWGGCTEHDRETLDKIQYEAARIVTGLTRSVSIERLLNEIGWVSLGDRRLIQKLTTVYKIKNNSVPPFLINIFPELVSDTVPYSLRNRDNFVTVARRTQIYSSSFVVSASSSWNKLDASIRNAPSLDNFKSLLKTKYKPKSIPKYYFVGDRVNAIYHARIRNLCSNLKSDLLRNHLSDTSVCHCGYINEDAEHYFFRCPRYREQRYVLFTNTRVLHPLSLQTLLYGKETFNVEQNSLIFLEVQRFIKNTKRFDRNYV